MAFILRSSPAAEALALEIPAARQEKAIAANKTQHKEALTTVEIGELLKAVDGHGGNYQTQCAFNLMWLTLDHSARQEQAA